MATETEERDYSPEALRERERARRMDDEGAEPLSAAERANLDQIGAGLRDGDEVTEPNRSDNQDEAGWNTNIGKSDGKRSRVSAMINRRSAITGGVIGLIIGGGFGVFSILQGPMQLLHLNASLGKTESGHTTIINRRINRMLQRAMLRSSDDRLLVGRSRLGFVHNRVFGGMLDRLEQRHGIRFTETIGPVTGSSRAGIEFNLPDGHELKGRSATITKLNIARALGIDSSKISGTIGNNEASFRISQAGLTNAELDGVKGWLSRNAGAGRLASQFDPSVSVAMNKRLFAKVLKAPSLFHPISRASEAAGRRIDNNILARRARKQADAERSRKSMVIDERKTSARSNLRSKAGTGIVKTAGAAIAVQGVMCMVKDIANIIPTVYYATVVTPAMVRSIQTQSAASQLMSGQNFTATQLGDVVADFKDPQGGTIWEAKSLNALSYGGSGTGVDIDSAAKTAFTTQGGSIAGLTTALGYDEVEAVEVSDSVAGWACSKPGRLVGLAVGVAITVGGVVSGVVTGGTTTAGAVGRVAVQAALASTVSYAVSRILGEFVGDQVKNKVADSCGIEFDSGESGKPEDIEVLDAKKSGNCLAYAARMSSNINAMPMGGVPISREDEVALLDEASQQDLKDFQKQSMFARVFSTNESKSLLATVLHPSSTVSSLIGNNSSLATSILRIPGGLMNSALSIFTPRSFAATDTYDWGFPLVSMPVSVVDDPRYADPLENVEWISNNITRVDRDRVKRCFGVEITGEMQTFRTVPLDREINPLSDDYNNANCGDLSDELWIRTALFVMDDAIARTMDCTDGGESSCTEIGIGDTIAASSGSPSTNPTNIPGLNGTAIPCTGQQRSVQRIGGGAPRVDWTDIPSSGTIGTASDGSPINVYVRDACDTTNVKTIFIASSIHGSENGGQFISHELLFNATLPANVRIVAIPEINKAGMLGTSPRPRVNANGINLNRNFDYNWVSSSRGDNYNDSGPSPNSEPEAQALTNFLNALGKVELSLHYHDNISWVAAAGNTDVTLARAYAANTPDTPLRSAEGGKVYQRGSLDGWHNQKHGVPTLLIEMSNDQSTSVIDGHVRAVKALAEGGLL